MSKFFGFVVFCCGAVLLPVPSTMLFGVSYATALGAALLAFGAALLLRVGFALLAS